MLFFKHYKFGIFGRLGVKDESFAPPSWKTSLWEKFKNNDVFKPINIHDENNIRELRFIFNKKIFILGINIFLFSYVYSFAKDIYTVANARYNLNNINKINFNKDIPQELLISYNWKKFLLESIKNDSSKKEKIKELEIQIKTAESFISAYNNTARQIYFDSNYQNLKTNLIPLGNDLLILYMITKYYWKRKKV